MYVRLCVNGCTQIGIDSSLLVCSHTANKIKATPNVQKDVRTSRAVIMTHLHVSGGRVLHAQHAWVESSHDRGLYHVSDTHIHYLSSKHHKKRRKKVLWLQFGQGKEMQSAHTP